MFKIGNINHKDYQYLNNNSYQKNRSVSKTKIIMEVIIYVEYLCINLYSIKNKSVIYVNFSQTVNLHGSLNDKNSSVLIAHLQLGENVLP